MSNVGYDLDTSGGLMPLIKALIKPPDEEVTSQKPKKPQHPYYKRPGKGHNHDSCDACGEGGDLICCDRCPASFHLGCYDPPLDENDIPAGLWLCKECHGSDENQATSSRSSRAQSPADSKSDTEKKTRSLRNNCANSNAKKKGKEEEEEVKKEPEPEKEPSPMEILVKAAKIMNPTQFELPREMRIPCIFPGTEKDMGKNGNGSLVTTDAWGCVPLPALLCFVCRETCKQAPLLHCDYCPLLFHQDCLDPPLTALPTGRWMCPNHVEQYIDWKLVNSISATERVALWDRFAGPVDHSAVQLDFIRRARRRYPPFRLKLPQAGPGRVAVPAMVRLQYRRRAPLLPARREHVRCARVLKKLKATGQYESSSDEEGPKRAVCLNSDCPQYCGTGPCPLQERSQDDEDMRPIKDSKSERHTDSSSDLSDSDLEYYTSAVKRRKVVRSSDKSPTKRGRSDRLELRMDAHVEHLLAAVDEQLDKLDERLVKLLAWQRLQQVVAGEQCCGLWRWSPLAARAQAAVRRSLDRARAQRQAPAVAPAPPSAPLPSELLSARDRERIVAAVWGPPPPPPPPPAPPKAPAAPSLADAVVRAVLAPVPDPPRNGSLEPSGRPVPMRLSSLSVGSDSGCDVRLDGSACRRVSRRHAVIFMDEVTRHFELINYSEWGTCVNGVRYACDAAARDVSPPTPALLGLSGSRPPPVHRANGDLTRPGPGEAGGARCRCGAAAPGLAREGAWEGSALVPHGALLHFGCQAYVFCVTDHEVYSDDEPAI